MKIQTVDLKRALEDTSSQGFIELNDLLDKLTEQSIVEQGDINPAHQADLHTQYFNTTTQKYWRNVDGGTTWSIMN